jgi:hypothetical protein
VNQTLVSRVNPWLVVALVAATVALAAVVLVASQQSGLLHMIGGTLQGPQQMAPVCPGAPIGC